MDASPLLVTGGAGFIGANLVHLAVARGHTVVTLDALTYAASRASLAALDGDPRHRFVHGSILDRALLDRLLAELRPRAILNLAAETHVDRSIDDPAPFVETNLAGTFALLEAARAHHARLPAPEAASFRFLQVSTDEVYGSTEHGRFSEQSAFAPSSPYAATKAGGDALARAYARTYGLPVVVTHGCNNYGPYQFPEKLVPLVVLNGLERRPIPVYGDGRHVREWLHARDHAAALLALVERGAPGESYNVGAGETSSNLDLVGALCAALDRARPEHRPHAALIRHVADRPGHDRRYALDCAKLVAATGWRPEIALAQGLADTVSWYLANEAWWRETRRRHPGERLGLPAGKGG